MINWETVAIPFAAGIKPVSHGRVLDQTKLLTAQNCFFYQDEGPQKRYGHTTRDAKTDDSPPGLNDIVPPGLITPRENFSLDNPNLSAYWLFGHGLFDPATRSSTASAQPRLGHLFGQWTRDSEVVHWDGFRALSRPALDSATFGEVSGVAAMPAAQIKPIAKTLHGQTLCDAVDNGVVRTAAWISSGDVYYEVFDSSTEACKVPETQIAFTDATNLRLITAGPWTHIIVEDSGALLMRSFHQDTPGTVVSRSLGNATVECFDVKKSSETRLVVARIDTNQITILLLTAEGNTVTTWTPDQGGTTAATVAIYPTNSNLGVLWGATGGSPNQYFREFVMASGLAVAARITVTSTGGVTRTTLASKWLQSSGNNRYTIYIEDNVASVPQIRVYTVTVGSAASLATTRYQAVLGSHACAVGEKSYVWCLPNGAKYSLQNSWVLCDETLLAVGKCAWGLARYDDIQSLRGINWTITDSSHPIKDVVVFNGGLGYKLRANVESELGVSGPGGVWQEPSILFYKLDFLPRLNTAQAGRSTYIAGAQLWEYDGVALTEANFHLGPEGVTDANAAGTTLDAAKTYRYRVDLCYKNAQNEEIRSLSIAGPVYNAGEAGGTIDITLTIPHVPFGRRERSYFLIYRTEGNGTEYYLLNSRDPDGDFVMNDRAAASYTYLDEITDAQLISREYHPSNAANFLQPLSAPACETVAAGRDRLWVAGGELSPGEIAPSRLYQVGEVPAFSPALNLQIDRNSEPITAIGFVGEVAAFFRRTSTYTLESDGPDNTLQGVWGYPRLALADVGAVSQSSLALAGEGLYFQSPAGFRVLQPGGGMRPPGAGLIGGLGTDVDTLSAGGDYIAVVVPKYSQVRWYSRTLDQPSLVVDYTKNTWTTFTGVEAVGATFWHPGDTVILSRSNAEVWKETEGRYLDGDRTYEMIVRTAWMHGGAMGDFQRARWWALFGEADTGLNLRYRVFYDEREYPGEEDSVVFNDNLNDSEWGDLTWGAGSWGDGGNSSTSGLNFRDGVFRLKKRFDRQKCSVVSLEFSDQGSNAAFSPVVLGLQLGRKGGLDRIP